MKRVVRSLFRSANRLVHEIKDRPLVLERAATAAFGERSEWRLIDVFLAIRASSQTKVHERRQQEALDSGFRSLAAARYAALLVLVGDIVTSSSVPERSYGVVSDRLAICKSLCASRVKAATNLACSRPDVFEFCHREAAAAQERYRGSQLSLIAAIPQTSALSIAAELSAIGISPAHPGRGMGAGTGISEAAKIAGNQAACGSTTSLGGISAVLQPNEKELSLVYASTLSQLLLQALDASATGNASNQNTPISLPSIAVSLNSEARSTTGDTKDDHGDPQCEHDDHDYQYGHDGGCHELGITLGPARPRGSLDPLAERKHETEEIPDTDTDSQSSVGIDSQTNRRDPLGSIAAESYQIDNPLSPAARVMLNVHALRREVLGLGALEFCPDQSMISNLFLEEQLGIGGRPVGGAASYRATRNDQAGQRQARGLPNPRPVADADADADVGVGVGVGVNAGAATMLGGDPSVSAARKGMPRYEPEPAARLRGGTDLHVHSSSEEGGTGMARRYKSGNTHGAAVHFTPAAGDRFYHPASLDFSSALGIFTHHGTKADTGTDSDRGYRAEFQSLEGGGLPLLAAGLAHDILCKMGVDSGIHLVPGHAVCMITMPVPEPVGHPSPSDAEADTEPVGHPTHSGAEADTVAASGNGGGSRPSGMMGANGDDRNGGGVISRRDDDRSDDDRSEGESEGVGEGEGEMGNGRVGTGTGTGAGTGPELPWESRAMVLDLYALGGLEPAPALARRLLQQGASIGMVRRLLRRGCASPSEVLAQAVQLAQFRAKLAAQEDKEKQSSQPQLRARGRRPTGAPGVRERSAPDAALLGRRLALVQEDMLTYGGTLDYRDFS